MPGTRGSGDVRRGRPPTISRAEIATEALRVADSEGLAAVSFRRLAQELGFSPMAFRRHFANRDDLLDAMVGEALSDLIGDPTVNGPWQVALADAMRALRDVLLTHPAAVQVLWTHYIADIQLDGYREHLLSIVEPANLDHQTKIDLLLVLGDLVLGSVTRAGRDIGAELLPPRPLAGDAFECGLDWVIRAASSTG